MSDINDFTNRLQAAFQATDQRLEELRAAADRRFQELEVRYEKCDQLRAQIRDEIAKPRLEALLKHFANVEPRIEPGKHRGSLVLSFDKTPNALARVTLRVGCSPDTGAKNLIAEYDLEILPVFVEYEKHANLTISVDQPDLAAIAKWLDDRLVNFVQTYLSLQFVDQYQQDQLVTDPVAEMRFPKGFAIGTADHAGKTYYFITANTRAEFQANPERFLKT